MRIWHRVIHPITGYFRRRRAEVIRSAFPDIARLRICDVGGSRHFWDKLGLPIPSENVVIYNIDLAETETVSGGREGIEVRLYDGRRIPEPDGAFDLVLCNSVIEHVPPDQHEAFAAELRRIGRGLFLQTPNFWFPVEPHFLLPVVHWLPRRVGFLLAHVSPWRLLSRQPSSVVHAYWWGTRLLRPARVRRLFPDAELRYERVLGLPKSIYAIRRAPA